MTLMRHICYMLLWQKDASLKQYNTFGMEVKAEWLVEITDPADFSELLQDQRWRNLPRLILGGGSNILFTKSVSGVVLVIKTKGVRCIKEQDHKVWIQAQAGEVWHSFVLQCIENGWAGLENLSLIPGSVGASPMQNIGAYGVEIKDVFSSLEALDVNTGELRVFNHNDCNFGYRESVFKKEEKGQWIISSVTFCLDKIHHLKMEYGDIQKRISERGIQVPTIQDVSEAVCYIRQSKLPDPKVLGNAGSFFKNPVIPKSLLDELTIQFPDMPHYTVSQDSVKVPAGWLIEKAGWKGKKWERCAVHERQALVLVNWNEATGQEVWDLSSAIVQDIQSKFRIELEREVNVY